MLSIIIPPVLGSILFTAVSIVAIVWLAIQAHKESLEVTAKFYAKRNAMLKGVKKYESKKK